MTIIGLCLKDSFFFCGLSVSCTTRILKIATRDENRSMRLILFGYALLLLVYIFESIYFLDFNKVGS